MPPGPAMTLYGRLTLALLTAACGGATALAATAGAGVAPTLTWGALLGGVLACVVLSARWVLRPLRRLAADLGGDAPPPADRAMEFLTHRVEALRARVMEDEARVEARVVERLAGMAQGNQALSLLFVAVSADEPGLPVEDFVSRLASRWVREGRVRAAGVAWAPGGPGGLVSVVSGGEHGIGVADVPRGLLAGLGGPSGHSATAGDDALVWLAAGVPVPADPRPGRAPAALLAAWPADAPPTDAERVACATVARYLALRAPASPTPTPTPGSAPREEAARPAPAPAAMPPKD